MSAALSSNTHQSYQPFYDQRAAGWCVPQNPNSATNSNRTQRSSRRNDATDPLRKARRKHKGLPTSWTLTDCVKNILLQYGFDKSLLDSVIIHNDGLPTLVELSEILSGPKGAVTWGNDVYFNYNYDPSSSVGISKIAHEVAHVKQFAMLTKAGFSYSYAESYGLNLLSGMSPSDAYYNDALEVGPYDLEAQIRSDLLAKYGGNDPCP